MAKIFLYMRGQAKTAQREKLQAEFPQGETVIDRRPPGALERLISDAGPGDLIAAANIYDMPELTAETYKTICSKGAGLHFQQQPHLNSAVFSSCLAGPEPEAAAAVAILQRQLNIEAERQAEQREKEKTGRKAAAAEGRPGGRRPGEPQSLKKEQPLKVKIRELMAQGLSGPQMLDKINADPDGLRISINTLYKYKKQIEAQDAQEKQQPQEAP